MKKGSLLTSLLLLAFVAQAEKFDHIEEEVAALAKWLLLIVRQRRKTRQARERERMFYELL